MMKINSVSQNFNNTLIKLGRSVQKKGSFASKVNKFTEGRGINPGRGAFLALISICTLVPRFLQARDADERSEIVRRDVTTIVVITLAMKAIKAALSSLMAKKSGLPLTFTNIPENANPLKKTIGYFQQKGTTAFSAEDITANYANIDGKETLTRFLTFIDDNKGNAGKVLTFDRAKGSKGDGALTQAAKKLLGENFDFTKPGKEIIAAIQGKDASNSAFNELSNILKDTNANPISKFGKGINAKFETIALITVASFLGFGLPKLNEKMTKDKYLHNDGNIKDTYKYPNVDLPYLKPAAYHTLNNNQKMIFQNFLGSYDKVTNQNNRNAAGKIYNA